jgi:hypothetical protein
VCAIGILVNAASICCDQASETAHARPRQRDEAATRCRCDVAESGPAPAIWGMVGIAAGSISNEVRDEYETKRQ